MRWGGVRAGGSQRPGQREGRPAAALFKTGVRPAAFTCSPAHGRVSQAPWLLGLAVARIPPVWGGGGRACAAIGLRAQHVFFSWD